MALIAASAAAWTFTVRAELPDWVRDVDAASRFRAALFEPAPMPGGVVEVRRTPEDAYTRLSATGAAAGDREILAMRARVAEEALDAAAAEAQWVAYAAASPDAAEGQLALADFYHRRLMAQPEADALARAAAAPDPPRDRFQPIEAQRSWRTFERLLALADAQQLPDAVAERAHRAWIARYPAAVEPYTRLLQFLLARDRTADVEPLIAAYRQAVPADEGWPMRARAEAATRRGAVTEALAVYDQAFQPLWDTAIIGSYFELLERTYSLRTFLERARADAAARPADPGPVARLFYYYQRTGNMAAAEAALAEFETRRAAGSRTAGELLTLAGLYGRARNYEEAIRYQAAAYSLPGATAAEAESALGGIIETLLTVPEQPIRFGNGDLSFYRDIATLDGSPGFFNGALSLLFNSASPQWKLAEEETRAAPYFRRGRAADLLALFDARFPASARRAPLRASLVATYAAYGASDAVIDRGQQFLASFPDGAERTSVMLAMADAYARKNRVAEELALYDRLLQELAQRADRMPIGDGAAPGAGENRTGRRARSPEYARVLDRYVARLVSRKQFTDALAVYRREIDRNPDDPGIYEATAQFLDANEVSGDVEAVYRAAMQRFPERSWHDRLARWYLRMRRTGDFEALTRDAIRTFDGTALARYFASVRPGPPLSPQLYLQLNRYAYERFPHHLTFVRNLLNAYTSNPTRDDGAYETLLRAHWFEDDDLRSRFFALLSRTGRLDGEMDEVRRTSGPGANGDWTSAARQNPAAARFLAESDVWGSHFEAATPVLSAVSAAYPADAALGHRAASLHRSLAHLDEKQADAAAAVEDRLRRATPRDPETLTRLGEIYADRGRYDRARGYWNDLPAIEPGRAAGYLEAATIFWDYYQFDDALRLIEQGRSTLKDPALYAYEAGAVRENMRQFDAAVAEYVKGALAAGAGSPAERRLLTLARRPELRDAVEQATIRAAGSAPPSRSALSLRIAVLEAQERRPDLERFLLDTLDRRPSIEIMAAIGADAARLGFDAVRTRALTRQIDAMTDPVEKLRLRYELVRLYDALGDTAQARQTLEAVYGEQPRLLGVVRQTVDYYWRHDLRREAIAALTSAAAAAYPDLRRRFTFEAARKATELADYARARGLLRPLLADDPFNAEYLAATAETYGRAGDDQALRDFYVATIEALRTAPLAADERTRRIAGLRRGLIPALTRLNDYAGAVDQYIEIMNRFPDDEALLGEAGRYARRHDRGAQLIAYYTKTAAGSPRDYRWPMLLARLETQFEDYPAAIAAYAAAIAIRPDRPDFHTSRAALEERLLRFDAAIDSYTKAYELTYHAPEWMEQIAQLHARRGDAAAAARAVRTAFVEGRPDRAENFFAAADRLERWNMLGEARPLAESGAQLAGPDGLLAAGRTYFRVATRLRQTAVALDRLLAARAAAPGDANGARLADRLRDIADVVAGEFTPEEKAALAASLAQRRTSLPRDQVRVLAESLLEPAGLSDLAAQWSYDVLSAAPQTADASALIRLQTRRLQFAALGQQLEEIAPRAGQRARQLRVAASDAYRRAGDPVGELRILAALGPTLMDEEHRTRYFELLLAQDPQRLMDLAATAREDVRNAAAAFVVGAGTPEQALAIVQARGRGLPPVWTDTYTALVGLHRGRFDAGTTRAFRAALGPMTVGDRMRAVDRATRLAGDTWFAQASRFGEYLTYAREPGAEDYLDAELEHTPARSDAYVTLADFYRDRSAAADALAEYDRASELNASRSDVHVRAAELLLRRADRAAALARWTTALQLLEQPQTAAESLTAALESLADSAVGQPLHDAADRAVRAYLSRHGTYRAAAVLRAAFRAAGGPDAGTGWLLDLARSAPDERQMLAAFADAAWLPDAQRDRVYERIVSRTEQAVAVSFGAEREAAAAALGRWRLQRIRMLLDTRRAPAAAALFAALPAATRTERRADVLTLDARIAAAEGRLPSLFDRLTRGDEPEGEILPALRTAAAALRRAGDRASERRVMEFVFTREIARDQPGPAPFIGLAEIRLDEKNPDEAMALLRRVTMAIGAPFEHHAAAAALLERFSRPASALEFRRTRAQAVPWDGESRLALARTELKTAGGRNRAVDALARLADSPVERYALRVEAARALAAAAAPLPRPAQSELDLLRSPAQLMPATADRPMFVDARAAAAERAPGPAARVPLLRSAIAVDPSRTDVRVALFRAQRAAADPAAAIESLLSVDEEDRPLIDLGLPAAERYRLARELAEALEGTGRLNEAVRYYTIALEGQPAATLPAVRARIAAVNEEIRRRATNAARRPAISAALDQPRLVRPLIPAPARTAGAVTPPAGARP